MSDISWRAHPDYRGEQSLNLIAHTALGGIDHPGRVFLALDLFPPHRHRRRRQRRQPVVGPAQGPGQQKQYRRARIIGAAIRAAHMLSIGRPGIIDETTLSHERDRLVLTLPKSYAALDGERLRRRFAVLASLLERVPEVRLRPDGKPLRGPGSPIDEDLPDGAETAYRLAHGRHDPILGY